MTDYVVDFNLEDEDINADFELDEGEVFNAILQLDVAGSLWGNISGDIENQEDLQQSLSEKADIDYVDSIVSAASDTINARIDAEVETLNTEINKKVETVTGDDFINVSRNGSAIIINSKTFIFEQAIAADTWVINYDWSYKQPSIDVIDSAGNIQLPNDINYTTNTITLSFLAAFSGKAYLN